MLSLALGFTVAEEKNIEQTVGKLSYNHRVKRAGVIITGAVTRGLFTIANTAYGIFPGANYGTGSK
jgi:hypothetical protein